ncbi:MAG: hypothetical protein Q9203_006257 [Teloschistes exilis]
MVVEWRRLGLLLAIGTLPVRVFSTDILKTSGFTSCLDDSAIQVTKLNVQYDRSQGNVVFDIAGSSGKIQNVTASLTVTAYGSKVYTKDFNPCDPATAVAQLCPVPAGTFSAQGTQTVTSDYANQIPAIAFNIPDLDGLAKMELKSIDDSHSLACIESNVNNGKTAEVPAVSYIAAGIAAAALLLSGFAALGSAGSAGGHPPSPNFGDVIGWFQSVTQNGMLTVSYPPVYRSFSKNFAFSAGLIPWNSMQSSIDNFRKVTGGNLTQDSVEYLRNSTLVYGDGSTSNSTAIAKRAINMFLGESFLYTRDVATSVNGTQAGNSTDSPSDNKVTHVVHGIQGYVEQLTIPQANTFLTVLLVFAIVLAAIAVGILLFKVILEAWALFASFPKKLTGFRKRYWGLLGRTITNLILLLYGVWTLYCVYQFTNGDSWAAKVLAGVTFAIFTAILGVFTFRIWQLARRSKRAEGDTSVLFEDKETWRKYSLFYDNYKRGYWWLFMPAIVYMFAKGCVIAAGNGHGLVQTAGQLIIESLMLALLLWNRPYATKAGNWINVFIQVVRVLSVVCILVFVEELGISQSTKTITGVVLIAVQSVLTVALAILIAVNSIIICCRENPHRKRRKAAEKLNRDLDNLTPLDARNSLLMDPADYKDSKNPHRQGYPMSTYSSRTSYDAARPYRDETPPPRAWRGRESTENLVSSVASIGRRQERSRSRDSFGASPPPITREPTVPIFEDDHRVNITTPLRCLCSDGEFELERYWAEQVLQKESQEEAVATLLNFTYYDNYTDLIRMEMNALAASVTKPRLRKFAVIGSGPLPLTSICLSRLLSGQGGAFVHNIDRDPWAISKSAQLCARLGYTLEQMRFQCADVHDQRLDLYGSDVVYLAGLVGITEDDKQDAISRIARQMSPGALLILRSAHSLRGLLYPIVNLVIVSLALVPDLFASQRPSDRAPESPYFDVVVNIFVSYGTAGPSQTSSSKRGLVYVPNAKHPHDDSIWVSDSSDLTWYYNYDSTPSPAFDNSTKLQFVPMLWGSSTTFLDDVTSQIKKGANITYVLTLNEPDGQSSTGGSAIPADTAAETWQREVEPLKKLGVKLGAPAVTGAPSGFTWLQNFFTACNGHCSVDFIPVHWYGNFEGLASHIGQVRGTYKNMTIWVTEYADSDASLKDSQSFYNSSSQYFDRLE